MQLIDAQIVQAQESFPLRIRAIVGVVALVLAVAPATVARAPGCTVIACFATLPQMKSAAPPKAPCLGDGESGKRVQLFYGQVVGQPDQSPSMIDRIRGAADAVNQAFRQAGNQNVRWACTSSGQTVIHILVPSNTLGAAAATLRSLGYTFPDRIYTVLETGPSPNRLAGQAMMPHDDRPTNNIAGTGPWYSIVWGVDASTLMHEEGHNMGAVQNSAPHASGAGHCYQRNDVMCLYDGGPYFQHGGRMTACNDGQTLADEWDCGRDDYYNPAPSPGSYLATHWNLYNSAFLSPN